MKTLKSFGKSFKFAAVVAALLLTSSVAAQTSFSAHVGPAIPVGDFGSNSANNDKAGGAALGINVGIEGQYKLQVEGLNIFVSADYMNNGLSSDMKSQFEEYFGSSNITYFKYSNIPVIGGLTLATKPQNNLSVFGSAGLGIDYLSLSDLTMRIDGVSGTMDFDPTTALAFKLGGGLIFSNKYTLALTYMNLGEHQMKGSTKVMGEASVSMSGSYLNVSLLTATFGVKF